MTGGNREKEAGMRGVLVWEQVWDRSSEKSRTGRCVREGTLPVCGRIPVELQTEEQERKRGRNAHLCTVV